LETSREITDRFGWTSRSEVRLRRDRLDGSGSSRSRCYWRSPSVAARGSAAPRARLARSIAGCWPLSRSRCRRLVSGTGPTREAPVANARRYYSKLPPGDIEPFAWAPEHRVARQPDFATRGGTNSGSAPRDSERPGPHHQRDHRRQARGRTGDQPARRARQGGSPAWCSRCWLLPRSRCLVTDHSLRSDIVASGVQLDDL